ncbi:hypothetical protein TNIN_178861 [Trichonephila inaurata madagascariensis]|uniref:Proline-rich nuclear receptor coactivator n=1 Tax=Trichonephila inaurata madagascariensis TaxID=2747483 RepID=A0A8X6Y3N2_9ARAC|nr:hypothetical protein TNIN_178861 [Trichonephila inaurata madagascariensis]
MIGRTLKDDAVVVVLVELDCVFHQKETETRKKAIAIVDLNSSGVDRFLIKMMETIDGGSNYMKIVQHSVHLNWNSALCSLVTPPRRTMKNKKRMSTPIDYPLLNFHTPPPVKAPENLSKSLPKGSVTRNSPSRMSPTQLDGNGFYAGAKFGERPPPTELPKPPNHWVSVRENKIRGSNEQSCIEMTNNLKVLLKVQS